MGIPKFRKLLLGPRQVSAVDERKASQSSTEFLPVACQQHDGTPSSLASAAPARAAGAQLKDRLLKLVPWLSRAKKSTSGDKQRQTSKAKTADVAEKEAWQDPSSLPDAAPDHLVDEVTGSEQHQEVANDQNSVAAELAPPVDDAETVRDSAPVEAAEEASAEEAWDVNRRSLAAMAREACEHARQQLALPQQQVDPVEELERQWAKSMFANMDPQHQQKLRVAIGLPALPNHALP